MTATLRILRCAIEWSLTLAAIPLLAVVVYAAFLGGAQ